MVTVLALFVVAATTGIFVGTCMLGGHAR